MNEMEMKESVITKTNQYEPVTVTCRFTKQLGAGTASFAESDMRWFTSKRRCNMSFLVMGRKDMDKNRRNGSRNVVSASAVMIPMSNLPHTWCNCCLPNCAII